MADWLGVNAPNIAAGWGRPPELSAPNIGGLVEAILRNKLAREKMTGESIADTIRNVQEQRQRDAYLDAAQQAGVLPEGDLGPLGVKGASLLAQEIQRKKLADSMIARREALVKGGGGHGRGSGGGGSGGGSGIPGEAGLEFVTDPQTGIRYQVIRTSRSVTYKQAPGQAQEKQIQPTRAERANAAPTIPGLTVYPDDTVETLQPDIAPAPDVSPTPPPADKNLAPDYGVKAVYMKAPDGTVSTVDPNLVEYYKSKGAVIVQGP